jgi:Cysteine-rich CPCC
MHRDEAIALLATHELKTLTREMRKSLLVDWWESDDEIGDSMDPRHDPLLHSALAHSYVGVINTYLEKRVAQLGRHETVLGEPEQLVPCPCCGYHTLSERGGYDICRVCFWEDDGTLEANAYSGPNHLTLGEGRANFSKLGAVTEREVAYVLPDGKERYIP